MWKRPLAALRFLARHFASAAEVGVGLMPIKYLLIGAAVWILAGSAQAGPVRLDYTGHVTSIHAGSPSSQGPVDVPAEVSDRVQVGSSFSGSVTFDTEAAQILDPNGVPVLPGIGLYGAGDWQNRATLGSYDEVAFSVQIEVSPGDASHFSNVRIFGNASPSTFVPQIGGLFLSGPAANDPLTSTDLSQVPWSLSAFSFAANASFSILGVTTDVVTVDVSGPLDTLTLTPVPEPVPSGLAGLAVTCLALAVGFRRARS